VRLSGALGSVKKGIDALTAAKVSSATATATAVATAPSLADAAAKSKRAAFDAQHDVDTAELESV
jgi:hypothetical protein